MSDDAPLIAVEQVSVSRAGRPLLDRVDLAVRPGEAVTLIGPNGAGKSTLVRIALGVLRPDTGRVGRRPGLTVGYMPQRLAVDPTLPLSVRRFLALPRSPGAAAIARALEAVGIAGRADAPLQTLSGGEFQRALLARAILREPDLLVLDEPAQGVDFNGQIELYQLIDRLRREHGCGVLLVSHDLHLVMATTDQVVCLNHHVCCSGAPERVSRDPAYVALFGPRAAHALAVYHHQHDHRHDLAGEAVPVRGAGGASKEGPGA